MTTFVWAETRDGAAKVFGDQPGGQLEADLIEHFQRDPVRVVAAIERVIRSVLDGRPIRSPWALIRHELDRPVGEQDVTATDSSAREKRILQAEAWIRNAGLYTATWAQAEEELFGATGGPEKTGPLLHPWADDPGLTERMRGLWEAQQERAARTELEAEERAARIVEQRKAMEGARQPNTQGGAPKGLRSVPSGPCDDCQVVGERWAYGSVDVCAGCAGMRARVGAHA